MKTIGILENTIQDYAWGSHTAIAELLGEAAPSIGPQAELWMGAHPKAPSLVKFDDRRVPLSEMIERYPDDLLGEGISARFHDRLPYLFKLLAAAQPLSIQAHPNRVQAKEGFERENRRGIPVDAPDRNYRDPNHKPECICALTPFWALCGFRRIGGILSYLEAVWPQDAQSMLYPLKAQSNPSGLKIFFQTLMDLGGANKQQLIDGVISNARGQRESDPVCKWMTALHRTYPSDIGVLSPMLFNLVRLESGQALFLPAGVPHAYLGGVGVELMANSDNVLRGGLTPKHIDVPELMRVLQFNGTDLNILLPLKTGDCEYRYPSDAEEFVLSVLRLKGGQTYVSPTERSIEILICTEGQATVKDTGSRHTTPFGRGTSIVVPASADAYAIEGDAQIYKAAVPI